MATVSENLLLDAHPRQSIKAWVIALAGLALGASLWFDRRSERVMATVQDKREEITVSQVPQGLVVPLVPGGCGVFYSRPGPYKEHRVGPASQVRLAPGRRPAGDPLSAGLPPARPDLRPIDRYVRLDLVLGLVADPSVWRLPLWLAGEVIGLWIASRMGKPVRHGGRRSRLFRRSSIRHLAVPYQVVQLSLAVPGTARHD